MRSQKTRSTRDRSIPRSLQRCVSTKSSISQMTFFFLIAMFKVLRMIVRSQQELLLSCCFFDHASSNINKLWLLVLRYLRVLFHQLASPPGFLVTHPERQPCMMYNCALCPPYIIVRFISYGFSRYLVVGMWRMRYTTERKCMHRWRINMNIKLSLHIRSVWYALLLHVSYLRRFFVFSLSEVR